jgi:DNA-binding NtrC family response regulator
MKGQWSILVVDDEEVMCESLAAWLREDGYLVDTASSGQEALQRCREKKYAICLIDLKMPGTLDGIETMLEIRKIHPEVSVIIITAYATVDTAVRAIKEGAQEYIVKPCSPEEISILVSRIIRVKRLQRENTILRKRLSRQFSFRDIISKNGRMHEIFQLVREIATVRSTVLIQGESGTGKDLIARAIHYSGDRSSKPFITVSCGALTETLLESELFGHEKGSFTGAQAQRKGKFELAGGGTILLDDIGEVSRKLQLDLLRVLQERRFYRVGGVEEIGVDVRVVAATNIDLQDAVRKGDFRDDLYYRLNVINIRLPALRERREDIPLLARSFIERLSHEMGKEVKDLSEDALELLLEYDWPGNVRELENVIERALVTSRGPVLTEKSFAFLNRPAVPAPQDWVVPADTTLHEIERQAIVATLQRTRGNITEAAAILGIDRSTLYDKIRKYEIARRAATRHPE